MKIQAEVSLYPLRTAALMESIESFLGHLRRRGLSVEIGPMSSRISGECRNMFYALSEALEAVGRESDVVLTVKVSNACPRTSGTVPDGRQTRSHLSSGGT